MALAYRLPMALTLLTTVNLLVSLGMEIYVPMIPAMPDILTTTSEAAVPFSSAAPSCSQRPLSSWRSPHKPGYSLHPGWYKPWARRHARRYVRYGA